MFPPNPACAKNAAACARVGGVPSSSHSSDTSSAEALVLGWLPPPQADKAVAAAITVSAAPYGLLSFWLGSVLTEMDGSIWVV
jgi:hypothetical protein